MNDRLTKKLVEKYPKIFPKDFIFEHGDGWYWLIDELCSYLQFETDRNDMTQIKAAQVKEKFGALRFYHESSQSEMPGNAWGAIRFAESLSHTICESCGAPGAVKKDRDGYISTLCGKCVITYDMEDLEPETSNMVNKNFWSLVEEIDKEQHNE